MIVGLRYADGLRASKTINGEKTDFIWNGQNLAAESSTNGINTYTYDMTGIHTANINGNAQSYLKDMHNNVVGLADENGNKTAVQYTYDARCARPVRLLRRILRQRERECVSAEQVLFAGYGKIYQ